MKISFSFFFSEGEEVSKTFLQPFKFVWLFFLPPPFPFSSIAISLCLGKTLSAFLAPSWKREKLLPLLFVILTAENHGDEEPERWLSDTEWRLLKIISCSEFCEVFHPTISLTTDLTSSSSSSLATQSLVTLTCYIYLYIYNSVYM